MKLPRNANNSRLILERLEDRTCPTIIASGTPVAIPLPFVHPGDTVILTATLNVDDPSHAPTELAEGEPLIIQSSGGFSADVSDYAQPRGLIFDATSEGETLSAFISGFDGDESADVTAYVGIAALSQQQKAKLNKIGAATAALAGGAGIAAAVSGPLAPIFGVFAGIFGIESAVIMFIAADPPDPNFKIIALPDPPKLTVTAQSVGTPQLAKALNDFLRDAEDVIGFGNALSTSLNRAAGAQQAGDAFWETRQVFAASQYSRAIAKRLNAQPRLLSAVQDSYMDSGLPAITITPADVLNYETNIASNGLPPFIVQTLMQLGANSATITQIRTLLEVQSPDAVAGTYPAQLTNQTFLSALQGASAALAAFAPVHAGQAAETSFWNGSDGQALINSFNGGSNSSALTSWLVSQFPMLYGPAAGAHNLTGQTNAQVAALFQALFADPVSNLDAKVLGVALDAYATDLSLGGLAGQQYGFVVTPFGLGASLINVGTNGAAIGVPDHTTLPVLALLKGVNKQAVDGVLYGGDQALRNLASSLLDVLIKIGSIKEKPDFLIGNFLEDTLKVEIPTWPDAGQQHYIGARPKLSSMAETNSPNGKDFNSKELMTTDQMFEFMGPSSDIALLRNGLDCVFSHPPNEDL